MVNAGGFEMRSLNSATHRIVSIKDLPTFGIDLWEGGNVAETFATTAFGRMLAK